MDNKNIVRTMIENGWNKGDSRAFENAIAPDAVSHDPTVPNAPPGAALVIQQMQTYRASFPDLRFSIDQMLADGDCVITRWTARGTHDGALMGTPATHRKVTVTGIQIDRFANGKVVESWVNWDSSGLMAQVGLMPAMGTASSGAAVGRTPAVHK